MKKITLSLALGIVTTSAIAQDVFPNTSADTSKVPIMESILGLFMFYVVPFVTIIVIFLYSKNKRNN